MRVLLQDKDSSGKLMARQLQNFAKETLIYIQVQGPGTVLISKDESDLAKGWGLQLTQVQDVYSFRWLGKLFALGGTPPIQVDIQVMQ
jgi:hypothetical protein